MPQTMWLWPELGRVLWFVALASLVWLVYLVVVRVVYWRAFRRGRDEEDC